MRAAGTYYGDPEVQLRRTQEAWQGRYRNKFPPAARKPNGSKLQSLQDIHRVEFFWRPFFFGARFFFVGGWCRLELCHFCKLWQEKTRISAEFRVLQPNTPFGASGPNTPFRASDVATQHSS